MATDAAFDPTEQDPNPATPTLLERKRPHDVDDASNTVTAHSTPRKRVRKAGKPGHQDVRDFVPAGATFSTSVVPIEEIRDSSDEDGSRVEMDQDREGLSGVELLGVLEENGVEEQKALVEGRRLLIRDLPPDTTEEHVNQFFKGYSIENIWLPDRKGNNSQVDTTLQNEGSATNGRSPSVDPSERAAPISTNDGHRLYVGNLSYAATVEDLREFFGDFSIENVTIPANPRTCRPVGYAFVTVSTSDEADRAMSQLSGTNVLDRKVSVKRARAEETQVPTCSNTVTKAVASATATELMEGYNGNRELNVEEGLNRNNNPQEISETTSPQDMQAAPPVSWNAVNTTKIRTTLGGSGGKVKDVVDQPTVINGVGKEIQEHSNRDVATSVALERVEGLRVRISSMNPHDGPVSAYKSAQQELHNAEVDYNYCLYFPSDEAFQPPPPSTVRNSTPKKEGDREYRLRLWNTVERSMKEGTLQALREGKIRVESAVRLDHQSPTHLEQINGHGDLHDSTATDLEQVHVLDAQETYQKQHGYLKALRHMKPGTDSYEKMKKRVHETEIHLNYCKYFPATEDYLPLALAKKGLNELNSSKIRGIERRAAQIWKLVEQCTHDGMLQDLKDGRLAAWLKDVPPPNQSFFASALQARNPQGVTAPKAKAPFGGGPNVASNSDTGVTSTDLKPIPKDEGLPNDRQDVSESDKGVILNLDYGNQDMPSMSEDEDVRPDAKSEEKDEALSSCVDKKIIIRGVSDIEPVDDEINETDGRTANNSDTESKVSSMDSEDQSEDGDAMMEYSNSEQVVADADESGQNKTTAVLPPTKTASVLADLSPHDLNAQLRYFHTTKAREEVDVNTPVKCIVCAKEGHMARSCESLTCTNCGAFNRHTTQACPNNAKCGKCREPGHDEGHCPYKLKRLPRHEIVCDLCQRRGHIEDDCELVWRTSGRPWESDLAHANVRLSCYECGHSGHLGNDCPSRKPHKAMGTSTWDGNMGLLSIKSSQEIKIKGKATRQNPINLDDSDDERANFYRPKVPLPEPVRRGQIRIITGRHESPVYEPSRSDRPAHAEYQNGSFAPINDTYRDKDARQPYQEYQDRGRGNWRAVDGPDYAADLRYNDRRPNERRSRSPPYRDQQGYAGGSSWPTPRPPPRAEQQDRRPRTDANVYRPMPSAAQNAWARRRL